MLEGLAVWALFIYILRVIGMPWNTYTKGFAYVGGASWLLFVWAGLLNYTPMDLSGGSVVQSPHIQLRPVSGNISGIVTKIHIQPNAKIKKGQLIYEIDETQYQIKLNKAQAALGSEKLALKTAEEQVKVAQQAAFYKQIKRINNGNKRL